MQNSIKIDLGSGYRHPEGFICIDSRIITSPDIVCDLSSEIPFKDSVVDYVRAHDFVEHIPIGKTIQLFEEVYRILKPNGMFDIFSPSTKGYGAFSDPTHQSFWNKASFLYYTDDAHRQLYGIKAKFNKIKYKDIFTNPEYNIWHFHILLQKVEL